MEEQNQGGDRIMEEIHLPLRQRMILSRLREAHGYMTGVELGKILNVTNRTIRNDIAEMNRVLEGMDIHIDSKQSFGYILHTGDLSNLKTLMRTNESFISRTERRRHIAERLSLADQPISLDELADEMYISKSTLEHDLKIFLREYVQTSPHIRIIRNKNMISFEDDERKKRIILTRMFSNNWDYNSQGNAFFKLQLFSEAEIKACMETVDACLKKYGFYIEDVNVVNMNLMILIAAYRIEDGYALKDSCENMYITEESIHCCDEILTRLEPVFGCHFNENERRDIYELLSCSEIIPIEKIQQTGYAAFFSKGLISMADKYLKALKESYHLDFSGDEDFYVTLLSYFRYLSLPVHNLNGTGILTYEVEVNNVIEFELAVIIQPYAKKYYGRYLDFYELTYLSAIVSGGMARLKRPRLRTIILTHYNAPFTWRLKAVISQNLSGQIEVTDLLPLYAKDHFDFRNTDLILSTSIKDISTEGNIPNIKISPFLTGSDLAAIENHIKNVDMTRLYGRQFPDLITLLDQADWMEMLDFTNYHALLKYMGQSLIRDGYVGRNYLTDIFRRERLLSFSEHPTYIIVHSEEPAKATRIRIATLNHRIRYGSNKIRMVIMICVTRQDRGLILKMLNELYHASFDPSDTRFLKTKEEYMNFIRMHTNSPQ